MWTMNIAFTIGIFLFSLFTVRFFYIKVRNRKRLIAKNREANQ